jgi:hypothetical protein
LIGSNDKEIITFNLNNRFCHMYMGKDYLLVASDSHLYSFTPDGSLLWTSEELGIDGVVVNYFDHEIIKGDGEWDPPGGWQPFVVNANNGKKL